MDGHEGVRHIAVRRGCAELAELARALGQGGAELGSERAGTGLPLASRRFRLPAERRPRTRAASQPSNPRLSSQLGPAKPFKQLTSLPFSLRPHRSLEWSARMSSSAATGCVPPPSLSASASSHTYHSASSLACMHACLPDARSWLETNERVRPASCLPAWPLACCTPDLRSERPPSPPTLLSRTLDPCPYRRINKLTLSHPPAPPQSILDTNS